MSDDLIRRSDVIKFLNDYLDDCYRVSRRKYEKTMLDAISMDFEAVITNIPSVEPKQEWTPCSERLPKKEEETYLICIEGGYMCSCRWTNDMYGLGSNEWSEWGWHVMDKPQYAKVVA